MILGNVAAFFHDLQGSPRFRPVLDDAEDAPRLQRLVGSSQHRRIVAGLYPVMDIAKGPNDPAELNRSIESAARFLNMQARNGIKPENLKIALVLHGSATRSALNDEAFSEHFVVPNASKDLIKALDAANVDIYVCGQSAAYNGYSAGDMLSEVKIAVSAMTVHVRLQQDGYQAILF